MKDGCREGEKRVEGASYNILMSVMKTRQQERIGSKRIFTHHKGHFSSVQDWPPEHWHDLPDAIYPRHLPQACPSLTFLLDFPSDS